MTICLKIFISLHLAVLVLGGGQLSLKLVHYSNPKGEAANGHCCDGRSIFCQSGGGCDHLFKLCVDIDYTGDDECSLIDVTTPATDNRKTIEFGPRIGDMPNPTIAHFEQWPGKYSLNVKVYDKDNNDDDFVDEFSAVTFQPPGQDYHVTQLHSRTRLTVAVGVECDDHWYGRHCTKHCAPQDPPPGDLGGHYNCQQNGDQVCLIGWTGEDCDVNIDDCESSPCLNNGTCVDGVNEYTCICEDDIVGRHCQFNMTEMKSFGCLNGAACIDTDGHYDCICEPGWTGVDCDEWMEMEGLA